MLNINIDTHKKVVVTRTISEKVNHLEEIMKCLAYGQLKTETELQEFKDEMKEFKEEMKEFKDCAKKLIEFLNKRWGNLANKI